MDTLDTIVIALHVLVALSIIGLVLLQQGKGAEMGASFGSGSSSTVFGAQGTGNVFSKTTAIFVTVFFVTSLWLAMIAKDRVSVNSDDSMPSVEIIDGAALLEEMQGNEAINEIVENDIPVANDMDTNDDVPMIDDANDIPE